MCTTNKTRVRILAALAGTTLACLPASGQLRFVDATARLGLENADGPINASLVCATDLNGDGFDDLVVGRTRVFLNTSGENGGRAFTEIGSTGLPEPRGGDVLVFADLDNDGHADAIIARSLDVNRDSYEPPAEGTPQSLAWLRGNGDGTFGSPLGSFTEIEAATAGTTASAAIGDVDVDGRLDIVLGQWYTRYGAGYEGYANDVLLQQENGSFVRMDLPIDAVAFDTDSDGGGRPTYGVLVAHVLGDGAPGNWPQILELNYGRRWNRLWLRGEDGAWVDVAPQTKLDGDAIRHGRHPDWLKERAKTDPRFDRADEPPFRANGNTFDAAIGDVNGDGAFDVLLAEITHGWAGESSDPSRVLVRRDGVAGPFFDKIERLSLDRSPTDPTIQSWNQGDIYGELADFDLDGRTDVLVCSSDYPDNQRLRIWRQQGDGSLVDITSWMGIDHIGAGQPALLDFDGDGDLDIVVGQGFNRLNAAHRAGRTPRLRVFENRAADTLGRTAVVLRLEGNPTLGVNRDAIGAMVRATASVDGRVLTRVAQVVGAGGHRGKQGTLAVIIPCGEQGVSHLEVTWPDSAGTTTVYEDLSPGAHTLTLDIAR
ncbi:MAG: FG-GAP repeat domain-containing protein [Phycisphaerales bacterium JB060]